MNDDTVEINKHKVVKLILNGNEQIIETTSNTVQEFLISNFISFDSNDHISKPLDTSLEKEDTLIVNHLETKNLEEIETITFAEDIVYTFDEDISYSKTLKEGVNGAKLVNKEQTYFANTLKETKVSEEVIKEPVNKLILKGSKSIKEEDIPFEEEIRETSDLFQGESRIVQEGQVGKKKVTYKLEEKVSEEIILEPKNKIIEVGTKLNNQIKLRASSLPQIGPNGLLMEQSSSRAQEVINLLLAIPGHKNGASYHARWGITGRINALTTEEAVWVIHRIEGAGFGQTGDGFAGYDTPQSHLNFLNRQVIRRFGGDIKALLHSWGTWSYSGY